MVEPSDEALVRLSSQGDERAFATLIRRHETSLVAVIRRRVGDPGHAEDVLQETLVQAWVGIGRLRDPSRAQQWLLQIARNRCRDFHKSPERRGQPTEDGRLELLVGRYGRDLADAREATFDLADALESVPSPAGDAARLFYLDGFTIAEIAHRHDQPEGTVKRHLFEARDHVRQAFGMPVPEGREDAMSRHRKGAKGQPFPVRRPEIIITPSAEPPFAVDCREGAWWFGVPEVGNRTMWAMYDPPEEGGRDHWRVAWVYDMQVVRAARVHDLDGVEVDVDEWNADSGWMPSTHTMYARITEEKVEWIAFSSVEDGRRVFLSYLDEGFEERWGPPMIRRMSDQGVFVRQEDGSYALREHGPGEIGAGAFDVTIGERTFTCLRVIDVFGRVSEDCVVMEAFLTRDGRTVLCRRYNGLRWHRKEGEPGWDERLPTHQRLVINGVTYVHWYDCLTDRALGIEPT